MDAFFSSHSVRAQARKNFLFFNCLELDDPAKVSTHLGLHYAVQSGLVRHHKDTIGAWAEELQEPGPGGRGGSSGRERIAIMLAGEGEGGRAQVANAACPPSRPPSLRSSSRSASSSGGPRAMTTRSWTPSSGAEAATTGVWGWSKCWPV